MLAEVIAVTVPCAFTEVVVCPEEPDDAETMAIEVEFDVAFDVSLDVLFPPVEVAVITVLYDDPFDPFPFEVEPLGAPDPPGAGVPRMSAETLCLMRRSTSPKQSIVTRSPRAKCPDEIRPILGTRHVSPPTLTCERPSLLMSPVVARCVAGCVRPGPAIAEVAISMPIPTAVKSVMSGRTSVQ